MFEKFARLRRTRVAWIDAVAMKGYVQTTSTVRMTRAPRESATAC